MNVTITPLQMSALRLLSMEVRKDATSYELRAGRHGYVEVDVFTASPSGGIGRVFIYEISPDGGYSLAS